MDSNNAVASGMNGKPFFLGEMLGARVTLRGKKIGRLADFVIIDGDLFAEVSHLYVSRPFGDPALVIPWDKVRGFTQKEVSVDIDEVIKFVEQPEKHLLLLKDDIVDKKILDVEGKEVEVAYDAKMIVRNKKLYVTDVDASHYGLWRRLGLKRVAEYIFNMGQSLKEHTVPWKYVEPLPEQIGSSSGDLKLKVLKEKLSDMHPVDIADIIEDMDHEQRVAVLGQLDTGTASDTLEEIEPDVQRTILAALTKKRVAQLVGEMTPGQAADVLAVMPSTEADKVLSLIDENNRSKIHDILERHEQKILDYATTKLLRFSPDMTVREAHELYRKEAQISDIVMYLYVVDRLNKLLGVIDIRELMKADDSAKLKEIMVDALLTLNQNSTLREASTMFERYSFRALPITSDEGELLGAVSYRDMVDLKHRVLE
jgi:magnesium transporter